MTVNVRYYGFVYKLTNVKEEKVEADKVSDIIKHIEVKYGNEVVKEVQRSFIVLNGDNIALKKGCKTKVNEGDTVEIITITAGG